MTTFQTLIKQVQTIIPTWPVKTTNVCMEQQNSEKISNYVKMLWKYTNIKYRQNLWS